MRRWTGAVATVVLAGCAHEPPANLPVQSLASCGAGPYRAVPSDVVLLIDASSSSRHPSGHDLDGDGTVSRTSVRGYDDDPDDSLLAAKLRAARTIVHAARRGDLRFALVTFSGDPVWSEGTVGGLVRRGRAVERAPLGASLEEFDAALAETLSQRGTGMSDFAAGMTAATLALGESDPEAPRRRMVILISDSPTTVIPGPDETLHADPLMKWAAARAIRSGVEFHTLGVGPAAERDAPHTLSRIATATGGTYRRVDRPDRLHCEVASALAPPATHGFGDGEVPPPSTGSLAPVREAPPRLRGDAR